MNGCILEECEVLFFKKRKESHMKVYYFSKKLQPCTEAANAIIKFGFEQMKLI